MDDEISEFREQNLYTFIANPESVSQQKLSIDQRPAPSPLSSFQLQSVNVEPHTNRSMPESQALQRHPNQETNENIIVNESPVQSGSVSYLNISFQEIINILAHNESPPLLRTIKRAINNSSFIVFTCIVYDVVALILETISLYDVLQDEQKQSARLSSGFFLLKWISDSLLLYSFLQIRYAINDSAFLGQGEVGAHVVEFLKFIIRTYSPFDDEEYEEQPETQAQWVARSIANKIDTQSWINFLVNYQSAHMYSINRIILISQSLLFIWGNAIILQEDDLHSFDSIVIIYSLIPGYFLASAASISVILVCASLPIMLILVIYQWMSYCFYWLHGLQLSIRAWNQLRARRRFMGSLRRQVFSDIKSEVQSEDMCVICLAMYSLDDSVITLPCNVTHTNGGVTNHYFHEDCIMVWIEEQGNCPVCRKRFLQVQQDD